MFVCKYTIPAMGNSQPSLMVYNYSPTGRFRDYKVLGLPSEGLRYSPLRFERCGSKECNLSLTALRTFT
jgi:hypothetical protein